MLSNIDPNRGEDTRRKQWSQARLAGYKRRGAWILTNGILEEGRYELQPCFPTF